MDFARNNKTVLIAASAIAVVLILLLVLRSNPSITDFANGLRSTGLNVEEFSGQDLKDMNSLVNSGKSGSFIFAIIARSIFFANGALSQQDAEVSAKTAADQMKTFKVDGVLVSAWRFPYPWQAWGTYAIEKFIREKDMASVQGNYCRQPGHQIRITCSRFDLFVHKNFLITISYIKEKVVAEGGKFVNHVPFDDVKIKSVRRVIEAVKL